MTKQNKQAVIDTIKNFYRIEETQGTNAKKSVLNELKNDKLFVKTLIWFFDSLKPTGIAVRKLEKDCVVQGEELNSLEEFLNYLDVNNTGRDQDVGTVQRFAEEFMPKIAEGIYRLAMKKWDKGLGIQATTVNNTYGDQTVGQFSVMLAAKYFDDPEYWTGKTFGIQEKLDGFRTVIIKRKGIVSVFARSGKNLTGKFPEIEQAMKDLPVDNIIFDGERMPIGFANMTSKDAYKAASNAKKEGNTGYCIAVYDYMPVKDWDNQHCNMQYSERYAEYQSLLKGNKFLFSLPLIYIGTDNKVIKSELDKARANQKEGLILKDMDGFYEWDRGQSIVKVKVFEDIDLPIVDFQEGNGKHRGRLGALLCDFNGNIVKVGSGFSDELRDEIWKNKKNWLGKIVEIIYFEKTENKQGEVSLRFPVYKTIKNGD